MDNLAENTAMNCCRPALPFLLCAFFSCKSTQPAAAVTEEKPKYEMKKYWLTFLYRGDNRTHDSATAANIQAAHIRNIERLAGEGKIIMAGPMGVNRDLRGIFIIDAPDSLTAAGYINTDSAVITGRLKFEVLPWWTAKGTYIFK